VERIPTILVVGKRNYSLFLRTEQWEFVK